MDSGCEEREARATVNQQGKVTRMQLTTTPHDPIPDVYSGVPWIDTAKHPESAHFDTAILYISGKTERREVAIERGEWELLKARIDAAFAGTDPNTPFATNMAKDIAAQQLADHENEIAREDAAHA